MKSFERRVSLSCDQYFKKPLIVYKISSSVALKATINILSHLISNNIINFAYVEDECFPNFSCLENHENFSKIRKFSEVKINLYKIDLTIIIGGDGTLLWANSLFNDEFRPPFLTFNLGTLGYMTYYDINKYGDILDELLNNRKCEVLLEKRSTLSCKFINGDVEDSEIQEIIALNDIVFDRGPSSHLIHQEIYINNEYLTKVSGDGLIIASSSGSTAYNLSAGGTIIHYDVDCMILNAICPHSLSFRPIAFPNHIELKILISEGTNDGYVTHDGIKPTERKSNQGIIIKVSDKLVNIILLKKFTENPVKVWKQRLINQLGWNKSFLNELK